MTSITSLKMDSQNLFLATNIRHLRNRRKMSQEELATQLQMNRSKLNSQENGATKNPPLEDLMAFSDFFKLSIDVLIKVDLTKLSERALKQLEAGNDIFIKGSNLRILATTVSTSNQNNVEMVTIKAKAGYSAGYGDPDFISGLPTFYLPHLSPHKKYRTFPISGDSMLPIPDGSYIIAEYLEDWGTIKNGTPCIVVTREDGIVFKLVDNQLADNRCLLLVSLNSFYQPYTVDAEQVLEVWKFHSLLTDQMPEAENSMQALNRSVQQIKVNVEKLLNRK